MKLHLKQSIKEQIAGDIAVQLFREDGLFQAATGVAGRAGDVVFQQRRQAILDELDAMAAEEIPDGAMPGGQVIGLNCGLAVMVGPDALIFDGRKPAIIKPGGIVMPRTAGHG